MSSPDTVTQHNIQLDVLRIAAIGAVVWLHTSVSVLYYGTNADAGLDNFAWWVSDIFDALSRWCVPVFVMISGALLLNDNDTNDPNTFYQRRVRRLLPPLLFWSLFYLAYRHVFRHEGYMQLLKDLINGEPYFHLWFLFMIFGLYAITPLLNVLLTYGNHRILFITAIAIFAIAMIEKTMALFSSEYTVHTTFLVLWLPFTAYFLMGYFVMKSRVRVSLLVTLVVWLLSSAVVAVEAAVVRFGLQKADV